jgi:hypothetical protein
MHIISIGKEKKQNKQQNKQTTLTKPIGTKKEI